MHTHPCARTLNSRCKHNTLSLSLSWPCLTQSIRHCQTVADLQCIWISVAMETKGDYKPDTTLPSVCGVDAYITRPPNCGFQHSLLRSTYTPANGRLQKTDWQELQTEAMVIATRVWHRLCTMPTSCGFLRDCCDCCRTGHPLGHALKGTS